MFKKISLVLAAISILGVGSVALACTTPPPQPPQPWIVSAGQVELYPCGPKYELYWIILHDYTTFGTSSITNCGCSLNIAGPIVSVTGVRLVDQTTGQACPGFNFCTNPGVSNSASQITGVGNFGGFLSRVTQNVPAGLKCDLWICVLTKPKTTFNDVNNFLSNQGRVVTGEVDDSGTFFDPNHFADTKLQNGAPGFVVISERPFTNSLPQGIDFVTVDATEGEEILQ